MPCGDKVDNLGHTVLISSQNGIENKIFLHVNLGQTYFNED